MSIVSIYFAFGVNIGNLSRHGTKRIPMKEWIPSLNERLRKQDEPIEIVDSFRHTGNFLLHVGQIDEVELRMALEKSLKTPVAIVSLHSLNSFLNLLEGMQAPNPRPGYRWTPGLVFQVHRNSHTKQIFDKEIFDTDRARFNRIASTTVAAWKLDCLDEYGKLDRDKRNGGWGAAAKDVSDKFGGVWTGRSLSTVIGTVKLTTNESSG
jgi:hypothetical protein